MKLTVGKRILMFFHWLFSLLICVGLALYVIVPDYVLRLYGDAERAVGYNHLKIAGIALLAIYALLAVAQIILIFRRRRKADRGFITVDSSDSGRTRIAISAIEQMVRQSVHSIDGITEMKITIDNQDDAVGIIVNATIVNGVHVPTITMNMQRSIRQFVEMNCGVAVRTVSITINSVSNQHEGPRRHRLRRGRSAANAIPEPVEPTTPAAVGESDAPAPEAPASIPEPEAEAWPEPEFPEEAASPAFEEAAAASEAAPAFTEEATEPASEAEAAEGGYDIDAPYESQFAKDLAALKARENAEEANGND